MADFRFHNANPLGEIEQDCVCRAISRGLKLHYEDIEYKLELIGDLFECDSLCVCCYHHLLEKVFGLTQRFAGGKTVEQLSQEYKNDILLIRIQGHLTVSEYGVVYDLWDCREEIADVFWIVS